MGVSAGGGTPAEEEEEEEEEAEGLFKADAVNEEEEEEEEEEGLFKGSPILSCLCTYPSNKQNNDHHLARYILYHKHSR